jgi:glycosyltransferase involved in cell wall biosynthesis
MRILHISPMYFPTLGGAELHLREISEGLAARGHQVTVFTANACNSWHLADGVSAGFPPVEVINGVRVVRFHPNGHLWGRMFDKVINNLPRLRGGHRTLNWVFRHDVPTELRRNPRLMTMIPYILRSRNDIVASMNWHWPPAYYTYLARRLKRFTLVGIPLFETAMTWSQRPIYSKMLASCDAILANTKHEAEFAQRRGAARAEVAGVGVHPESFNGRNGLEIRERYGLKGLPVVGYVGRQVVNKGAPKLIQSMKEVWRWNSEARVLLAGPRSPNGDELGPFMESLTDVERARVIRIDQFPERDKASIYDACDVFVLPSTGESFGIAYLDAWLCEKPVIGGRIGSTQCVIDEGADGLLADPEDPKDIARAIIDLLSDSSKRERMGRKGRAKTLSHFTWEKVTNRVEKLYLELAAAKTAGRRSRVSSEVSSD